MLRISKNNCPEADKKMLEVLCESEGDLREIDLEEIFNLFMECNHKFNEKVCYTKFVDGVKINIEVHTLAPDHYDTCFEAYYEYDYTNLFLVPQFKPYEGRPVFGYSFHIHADDDRIKETTLKYYIML